MIAISELKFPMLKHSRATSMKNSMTCARCFFFAGCKWKQTNICNKHMQSWGCLRRLFCTELTVHALSSCYQSPAFTLSQPPTGCWGLAVSKIKAFLAMTQKEFGNPQARLGSRLSAGTGSPTALRQRPEYRRS